MVVYDFDGCKLSKKTYGGHSCSKIGIESGGYYYMLKFPDNLKVKNMKNIDISYSNSPVCEYLGSHIYQTLDIPVHETYLGYRGGKLSVACLDFSDGVIEKSPFSEIKTTMEPAFYSPNGTATDGTSGDLKEVIQTLQTHPIFQDIPDAETRFWDMFIVDAFIGNTDRNNENWGVLQYPDHDEMMPVYDNGNCLNNKWSENQMLRHSLPNRNTALTLQTLLPVLRRFSGADLTRLILSFQKKIVSGLLSRASAMHTPRLCGSNAFPENP